MAKTEAFQQITGRSKDLLATDKSALFAIAQAAVNVELFTIPLYMTSLYSLQGTHQITGKNDFYLGRFWPGMATTASPKTGNDKAFNAIFSVFIAEMLHLQLASNICKAIGVTPSFTSQALQNKNFGWTCYGPTNTVIPHILDLKDAKAPYNKIKVDIGAVNKNQLDLFLAIEETEEAAEAILKNKSKYFPVVPFADWKPKNTESDLPMFGSIGYMYKALFLYLTLKYDDETTLWDNVFQANSLQRDVFNANTPPSHYPEYPTMANTITGDKQDAALGQVIDMIRGITDQGEGKGVIPELREMSFLLMKAAPPKPMLMAVKPNYQPDAEALEKDYPTYNDKGVLQEGKSRDAAARVKFGKMDHFETFTFVKELFDAGELYTWEQWHKDGKKWDAAMLQNADAVKNKYPIPPAEDVAGALNRLKANDAANNFTMLSQVVAGAIKGVTSVLNDYWNGKTATFPFPSMGGSGDRMSLCWAIFGKAPNLALGVTPKTPGILYHACQGMNLDANNPENPANCAAMQVFHTCKGSNTCAAEGGCGFVQNVNGGGSCGGSGTGCGAPSQSAGGASASAHAHGAGCGASGKPSACGAPAQPSSGCGSKSKMVAMRSMTPGDVPKDKVLCGGPSPSNCGAPTPGNCGAPAPTGPVYYSAPSANSCATNGGCAVPISASQIYPAPPDGNSPEGKMEIFNFIGTNFQPVPINTMAYTTGEMVYDTAWNAYIAVLQARNRPIPAKPKPSDIRLAFPPST